MTRKFFRFTGVSSLLVLGFLFANHPHRVLAQISLTPTPQPNSIQLTPTPQLTMAPTSSASATSVAPAVGSFPSSTVSSSFVPAASSAPFVWNAVKGSGQIPTGAFGIYNEKGPGLSIVLATQPWPTMALGEPPSSKVAGESTPKPTVPSAVMNPTQILALKQLQAEADAYRKGSTNYSRALSQIIRQRYEHKRKQRLSSLQENINYDSAELQKVRAETMRLLREFIGKYPDSPEQTPNALFRLAALHEEQALSEDLDPSDPQYTQKLSKLYSPAERIYREIIERFPNYTQRAAVQFFLGALLSDTGRATESQWVWRALVCSNRYAYPLPPAQTEEEKQQRAKWKDGIPPMPQDHLEAYWKGWQEIHYMPPETKVKNARTTAKTKDKKVQEVDNEDSYKDVYPDDCVPIGGMTEPNGEEARFVSQTWWRIGEYHFNKGDSIAEDEGYFGANPFQFNRAESAYRHAIRTTNETVKIFSVYKLAWTYHRQQRYNAARDQFLKLLEYFDEKEKKGGQGDLQMRQDAYDWSAEALTHLDINGPGPSEPYLEREDVFGKYAGKELEQKLEIAIARIQDPKFIPQDKPWTSKMYKSLAAEFESDDLPNNAIRTYELIVQKWECDPEAPQFTNKIAQLYEQLALVAKDPKEKDQYTSKALEARTRLLNYVGKTRWTECNKDNIEVLRSAELLMNEGVRNAAGRHIALGRAHLSKARNSADGSREQKESLRRAREEFNLGERGWSAYLNQDPEASDAYDSKYFVAEARHRSILATRLLGEPLDPIKVDEAHAAAVAVRDSFLDDKYLRYAAFYAVDVIDMMVDQQYDAFVKSNCAQGVGVEKIESPLDEPGDLCRSENEKKTRDPKRIWVRSLPPIVLRVLHERDEYVSKVPAAVDLENNASRYQFEVADALYRYGRFEEAALRFESIRQARCGKEEKGFEAWYRLAMMSNLRGDSRRSMQLVEEAKARSCAVNEEQRLIEKNFADPTRVTILYEDADLAFQDAEKETNPKLRTQKFRQAAARYEAALKAAPSDSRAPRGAINSAYCYKQINEYKRAAQVYRLFLDKYGREEELKAYRDGDLDRKIKKDPEQFKTRLEYTKRALDELGRTYLQAFDYSEAAKHYDEVANRELLEDNMRQDAALNAVVLQANLGHREKMIEAHARYNKMQPNANDRAELDFIVSDFEYKQWKQKPEDNDQRRKAIATLDKYYTAYKNQSIASKYVVGAAYAIASMRKAANEIAFRDWYRKTIDAFINYKIYNAQSAVSSREADYGAEAAYFFVNERIERDWDSLPGQPSKLKYEGSGDKVSKQVDADYKKAEAFINELEEINKTYVSTKWFSIVLARQGTVFDIQRVALAKAKVEVIDPVAKKKIEAIEARAQATLNNPNAPPAEQETAQKLLEQADQLRQNLSQAWKTFRNKYYTVLEPAMIDRYARAYLRGKQFNVRDAMVTRAVQRLAYYTDQLEDVKMRQYLIKIEQENNPPFKYKDQMFKQMRPGSFTAPAPTLESPNSPYIAAGKTD